MSTPLEEGAPSGPWLRREGTYAEVQEAVRSEDGDPSYGIPEKRPDWGDAERLCLDALTHKTRDFYLASMLTEALVHTTGATGLADGLWVIAEIHEHFWDDFHPQPRDEGTNIDGRLNQLDALIRTFPRILGALPTDEAGELPYADWRYAGGKLPGGGDSPIDAATREEALRGSSWEYVDASARALAESCEQLRRFDELVDQRYGNQAPSLSELKEALEQAAGDFARMLETKGPGPYVEQARQVLAQTGCSFVQEDWLAEHFRNDVSFPRVLNSIQAACEDERAGMTPEDGWVAHLQETWQRGESYERRSEPPAEPPPPAEMATLPASDPAAAAAPAAASASPSAPAAFTPAPASVAAAPVSGDALGALVGACRALRQSDPGQPIAYLALRNWRWAELWHLEAGATPPGPGDVLRQQLASLFEQQDWANLLERCEQALEDPTGGTWLDLQRFACAAMRQLGLPWGDRPREEIILALRAFLGRHPWLPNATLMDGGPAADDITRNWIQSEVLAGAASSLPAEMGPGVAVGTVGAAPVDEAAEELAEAHQLVESEGLGSAVALLQRAAAGAASARRRVMLQLGLGELCLSNGHEEIAVPVLEEARRALQESRPVSQWEGTELLARGLEALYQGYSLSEEKEPSDEITVRKRAVADELARVDPTRRLNLES